MRKFDPSRLYKLLKIIVLLVFVVGALNSYGGFKEGKYYNDQFLKISEKCAKLPEYKSSDCWMIEGAYDNLRESDRANQRAINSMVVAILTPLLFFGTVFLYKFLFPKKK